jgi:hypothetical protein
MSLPEVEISQDIGASFDISSIDALDIGLLANQKKLQSPPRSVLSGGSSGSYSAGPSMEVKSDDIEFVNLEDVGNTVSFNVRPTASQNVSTSDDTIRIVRDTNTPPPPKPISFASAPAPAYSGTGTGSGVKSWFSPAEPAAPPAPEPAPGMMGKLSGWFSGNKPSTTTTDIPVERHTEYLTPEQEYVKKTEALTMLERMDRKGITGNKMTVANSLEEIQAEVDRRKDSKQLEASIRFQRSMLTTVTNGMEFLNSRFDPLGIKLDGWSEQINENIEDYDEMFEELYDKYKDKSKVAPEVRLIMSLGLSAAMCHVTNTMFKSRTPGMDDILRNNPDLARQFAQAAAQEAVGPGFARFVSMGMPSNGNAGPRMQAPMEPPMGMGGMSGMGGMGMSGMGGMMGMGAGGFAPVQQSPPVPTARREMRGPTGVDDILQKLSQAGESLPDRSVPPPASPVFDAEEVQSVRSGMTTETARLAGRSRRKTTASQPVGATLSLNV